MNVTRYDIQIDPVETFRVVAIAFELLISSSICEGANQPLVYEGIVFLQPLMNRI